VSDVPEVPDVSEVPDVLPVVPAGTDPDVGLANAVDASAGDPELNKRTGVSEHTAAARLSNSWLRCRITGARIRSGHRLGDDTRRRGRDFGGEE
jgi:hypothetical protein